jgi:hypothetical protein
MKHRMPPKAKGLSIRPISFGKPKPGAKLGLQHEYGRAFDGPYAGFPIFLVTGSSLPFIARGQAGMYKGTTWISSAG